MSTPTITDAVRYADGSTPADTDVTGHIRLIASTTGNAVGYVETGGGQSLSGTIAISFVSGALKAANGSALALHPNSGSGSDCITSPSGTVYEYVYKLAGMKQVLQYITVSDVAGPLRVVDILTQAPGALAPPGSASTADVAAEAATRAAADTAETTARTAADAVVTARAAGGMRSALMSDSNGLGIGWGSGGNQWYSPKSPYCQAVMGSRGMLRNIKNNSVAGTTSAQILVRLQADLTANIDADVIFWAAGTNDYTGGSAGGTAMTVAQSVSTFETAAAAVLATGRTFVCISPPPVGSTTPGSPSGDEASHQAHVRMLAAAQRNYISGAGSSAILSSTTSGYSTTTPRAFYLAGQEVCTSASNGEWITGYNTTTDTSGRKLHFSELGAKAVAQLMVDWAENYCYARGGRLMSLYDGDTVFNTLTGGTFVGPLSGNAPPGWTYASGGAVTPGTLVAPTAADSVPAPFTGNWYRLTATAAQKITSIGQTWTGSASTGDRIRFTGRCQSSDYTGTGGFSVYANFVGQASYLLPLFGTNVSTQSTLQKGGDFTWDMSGTYPSGATGVKVWFVVRPDTVDDGVGITGYTQVGMLNVFNETTLNLPQYG